MRIRERGETGEVDQLVPIEEIREMDVEIVIMKKKRKKVQEQKIEVELEPLEHENPSLRFMSRSSLEIPQLMRFSLLDMTPKHSKMSALRTHVSEEVVADFNHVEPPPPSPPPPGLGFVTTIRVAKMKMMSRRIMRRRTSKKKTI